MCRYILHVLDGHVVHHHCKAMAGPISMEKQSAFKYILDIDGYATPWRLFFELSYQSVIILVRSKYTSWFYDRLKDGHNMFIVDIDAPGLHSAVH